MSALGLVARKGGRPRRETFAAIGSGALASAAAIGLMGVSAWLITRASQRPPVFALSIAMGAVQAFALGRGLMRYVERLSIHAFVLRGLVSLRLWLYDAVEPLVPAGLPRRGRGAVLSGLVGEVDVVALAVARESAAAIDVSTSIVCGGAVVLVLDPVAGAIVAGAALAMVGLGTALSGLGARAAASAAAVRSDTAEAVVDCIASARELHAYGREDIAVDRLAALSRRSAAAAHRLALVRGLAAAALTVASGAGLIAVVLAALAARAGGRVDGVLVAVIAFVALTVLDQVAAVPAALSAAAAGDGAAGRLEELAGLPHPTREPALARAPEGTSPAVALERYALDGILRGVSLEARPGERIAVTGPSGAGKTTALHALLHFVEPSSGRATVGGVDVRDMTRAGIARHVGWLPEDTHVFVATLGENLRIASVNASDSECVDALEHAGLRAWYRALPDGLATRVGAGGRPVSAGERQRLGMARALLSAANVLLLDEPTSHLDPETASEAMAELLGSAGARTVILVTHDAELAAGLQRVVALDNGRIVPGQRPPT